MYKLTNGNVVIKLPCMPIQPGDNGLNSMWDEYQEWLKASNTPLPADIWSPYDPKRDPLAEIDELKSQITTINTKLAIK